MPATAPTTTATRTLAGIHRAIVVDAADPLRQGRVRAQLVEATFTTGWALPCAPFGGQRTGLLGVPEVGAKVWLMFEGGDPDRPVWLGVFWGGGSEPGADAGTTVLSDARNRIALTDDPATGGLELSRRGTDGGDSAHRVRVDDVGIELRSGGSSLRVEPTGITMTCGATVARVEPTRVVVTCGVTTVLVTVADVTVTGPPTVLKVGPGGVTANGAPMGPVR